MSCAISAWVAARDQLPRMAVGRELDCNRLRRLWLDGGDRAARPDSTRLSSVPVPGLQRAIQRAQRLCPQSRLAAERPYRLRGVRRLRYSLTLRDLSEIMLLRGLAVSHELYPAVGEEAAAGDGRGVAQAAFTAQDADLARARMPTKPTSRSSVVGVICIGRSIATGA